MEIGVGEVGEDLNEVGVGGEDVALGAWVEVEVGRCDDGPWAGAKGDGEFGVMADDAELKGDFGLAEGGGKVLGLDGGARRRKRRIAEDDAERFVGTGAAMRKLGDLTAAKPEMMMRRSAGAEMRPALIASWKSTSPKVVQS